MSISTIIKSAVIGIFPVSCIYAVVNVPVICIHKIPIEFYNQQNLSSIYEPISLSKKNSIAFKKIYVWRGLFKSFYPKVIKKELCYQTKLITATPTPNYNTVLNVYSKNISIVPFLSLHLSYDGNEIISRYLYFRNNGSS